MALATLSACGGGGSSSNGGNGASPAGSSSVTCSSFTYQEDAQAYYRQNNATQLDADRDGIACESLPHRPIVTTPPSQPSPAATTAEGLWIGTTSTARTLTGLILDNGTYWFFYSAANDATRIAGVLQGVGNSLNGSFSSTDARDLTVGNQTVGTASLSGSYREKQSLNGTITYQSSPQSLTFTSAYSGLYDQAPSLSNIAGTYVGSIAVSGSAEAATVSISATGVLNGAAASGCQFSGTVSPRNKGNAFDISVATSGGVCSSGTSNLVGIGYLDLITKRLLAAALNNVRTGGLLFLGVKP